MEAEIIKEINKNHNYITFTRKQKVYYNHKLKNEIRLVFVMGKTTMCVGAKIIFQHANLLKNEGFDVSIVAYNENPRSYPVTVNYIQVPINMKLAKCIPDCDVIIATNYNQIQDCINTGIAPVVYFEQGDLHIYRYDSCDTVARTFIDMQFQYAPFVLTVSKLLAKEINQLFHKNAVVIHNTDDQLFCGKRPETYEGAKYLLMMGSDGVNYKGIKDIIQAYEFVRKQYEELKLYWITSEIKHEDLKEKVSKVFMAPEQKEIADLYRCAEMFILGSKYESFSLPVIEAMACGCPVITMENLGIREYGENSNNLIIGPPRDPDILAEKIIYLLNNNKVKRSIIDNAFQKIKKIKCNRITEQLVKFYESVSKYKIHYYNSYYEWDIRVNSDEFIYKDDYNKFMKVILWTDVSKIYIVKLYDINGVTIGHWELGAEKKNIENNQVYYCYIVLKSKDHVGLRSLMNKELDTEELIDTYNKCYIADEEHRLNYYRLTAYYLIKYEFYKEAKIFIAEGIDSWENCTDLYLLYAVVLKALGEEEELSQVVSIINALKEYTVEKYFIYDVKNLARKILEGEDVISCKPFEINSEQQVIYYFADKLYEYGLYDDAIKYYNQFIKQNEEDINRVIAAYRRIALSYFFTGDYDNCRINSFQLFQISQPRAEECYLIGLAFHAEKKYDEAIFWYHMATLCSRPETPSPFTEDDDWTFNPLFQQCLCYYEKGDLNKAVEYNEKAAKYKPTDKKIKANREFFISKGFKY